jgi:hypothetical protein
MYGRVAILGLNLGWRKMEVIESKGCEVVNAG